jgi:hypothetical protein
MILELFFGLDAAMARLTLGVEADLIGFWSVDAALAYLDGRDI